MNNTKDVTVFYIWRVLPLHNDWVVFLMFVPSLKVDVGVRGPFLFPFLTLPFSFPFSYHPDTVCECVVYSGREGDIQLTHRLVQHSLTTLLSTTEAHRIRETATTSHLTPIVTRTIQHSLNSQLHSHIHRHARV